MFEGCTKLRGGNGTKFNESYIDNTYARVDSASVPGYFTEKNVNEAGYVLTYTAFTYDPNGIDAGKYLTLTFDGIKLVQGRDYELIYQNYKKVGINTCTMTVKGINGCTGFFSKKLTIKPAKNTITSLTTKNGGITVNWKADSSALAYQVVYCKNSSFDPSDPTYHSTTVSKKNYVNRTSQPKPGEKWYVKVRSFITNDGKLTGIRYGTYSAVKSITVKENISTASIPYASYTYTGSAIKPAVTVKDSKGKKGTLTLTAGKASFKAVWTKEANANGYEIVYLKDKNFKSGVYTYTVTKPATTSANFSSKPKSGETWYVKYCAYTTMNGTKYGNFSAVKMVKTK